MAECKSPGCNCRAPRLGTLDYKALAFFRNRAQARGAVAIREASNEVLPTFEAVPDDRQPFDDAEVVFPRAIDPNACECATCDWKCDNRKTIAYATRCNDCGRGFHYAKVSK